MEILKTATTECLKGDIRPTTDGEQPEYIVNLFSVPKKNSETGQMTKLRIVRHGSFCTPNTTSINDWIQRDKCKMPSLPNLNDYCRLLVDKNFVCLRDLSNAFRQIGMKKKDHKYIGYSLFGLKFIDMKQPYGIASAAANCQSFAQIIIWILNNKKLPEHLRNKILVHIDDFIFASYNKEDCVLMQNTFDELCMELGVKISHKKDINAAKTFVVYGFLFDLERRRVGIPKDKLDDLKRFMSLVIELKFITGRALEKLCGRIMHWALLSKPSKSLCYNSLYYILNKIREKKANKKWFKLPEYLIKDLLFWLTVCDYIKEVNIESIIKNPRTDIYGSSDASNKGGGFVIGRWWNSYHFKGKHIDWHINQKEGHVVVTALYNLRRYLTGKRVVIYIDNATIYYAMCRHWASSAMLMEVIYDICAIMMKYRIEVWFEWIPTENNVLADTLSRFKMDEFWNHINDYDFDIFRNPIDITYLNDSSFKASKILV